MKAVHFGAGNIGRGFIGQILHEAGYEICFMDVNQAVIDEINELKSYEIEFVGENVTRTRIDNIYAVNSNDEKAVDEIVNADIVTCAVGANILKFIAPVIAKAIEKRIELDKEPINFIACENMIGGSHALRDHIISNLSEEAVAVLGKYAAFPNAAVDRIVPIQHPSEPLLVQTEPYHEWDVDANEAVGTAIKEIEGLTLVDNLDAYIERKLFSVNALHASIAYLGFIYGHKTIDESVADERVTDIAAKLSQEAAELLVYKYNFDLKAQQEFAAKILTRFKNPYLSDDVIRVGRAPLRKISNKERLGKPAVEIAARGQVATGYATAIAAALCFKNDQDADAVELQNFIAENSAEAALEKYCGIAPGSELSKAICTIYNGFQNA